MIFTTCSLTVDLVLICNLVINTFYYYNWYHFSKYLMQNARQEKVYRLLNRQINVKWRSWINRQFDYVCSCLDFQHRWVFSSELISELNRCYFNHQFKAITAADINKAMWLKGNHKHSKVKTAIKDLNRPNETGYFFHSKGIKNKTKNGRTKSATHYIYFITKVKERKELTPPIPDKKNLVHKRQHQ